MNNLESVIKKYAVENYGNLIVPDKPIFDENTKTWKYPLGSTYPRIIEDEITKDVLVGFLEFRDLGVIKINDKLQIIDATPSEQCDERLLERLDFWKQQSEKIVVTASSDVFAKIAEGQHVLNPLGVILDALITIKDKEIKISNSDIYEQRNYEKYIQYLELLEELQIVRKVQDGYIQGNLYVELLNVIRTSDHRSLKTILISHVIKKKYSTLRQVFDIRQLEPFVHLANMYYLPSLDAEKLIHISRPHLYQQYENNYKRITPLDFNSKLNELTDKGALKYESGYLVGNKEYFDNMLEMKQEVQLNPMM